MAQDKTSKTSTPDSSLKGGKVRPNTRIQVLFKNSVHHDSKPYHLAMVHTALAEKLVKEGKAEYFEGKLSKEQVKENEEHKKAQIIAKGRTPGKVTKADEDEFDDFGESKVMGTKNTVKSK